MDDRRSHHRRRSARVFERSGRGRRGLLGYGSVVAASYLERFERVRARAHGVYFRRRVDDQQRGACGQQQRLRRT